jgi:predicted DNA-binding transcriptional regulator AlpA
MDTPQDQNQKLHENEDEDGYVDYKVAMDFLGLKQATFFRRVKDGTIPSYEDTLRPGQHVFKMSELVVVKANRYKPVQIDNPSS